jgi:class 3 adenylate cyclase
MEPRIQYAQTEDGVSIAYSTLGEGIPFVQMPAAFGQLHLEWQLPEFRTWYERLAEKRKLVRYDTRGAGLSEREVSDFSLDAQVLDLEAVVDRLGLEKFVLFAGFTLGPVGIAYAARHPERVSHLVLWCSWARAADAYRSPQAQSIVALRDKDWKTYTETIAHVLLGWSEGEPARRYAELMRESITQETLRLAIGATTQFDVTALLPELRVATLVMHRRQLAFPDVNIARGLASRIPDARLAVVEGESLMPGLGDLDEVLTAIDEFLDEDEAAAGAAGPAEPGAFRTILFTDLVGHTQMMSRLGDDRGREVLREHEQIVREGLAEHGGTEVKTMGDGFMASFGSVTKAVECAIALQLAFADRESDEPLSVRVGINAGEPIEEDGDLFGATVILASRIAAKAEGGEILVADTIRGLCSGKGFLFADRGEFVAKGFEDAVRISEVSWRDG